jgi:hypothetical protein
MFVCCRPNADDEKRNTEVLIARKFKRRSRQTLGTAKLRAQVIDLLAWNCATQHYKDCHGKFA